MAGVANRIGFIIILYSQKSSTNKIYIRDSYIFILAIFVLLAYISFIVFQFIKLVTGS